jgi:hypothetical protein
VVLKEVTISCITRKDKTTTKVATNITKEWMQVVVKSSSITTSTKIVKVLITITTKVTNIHQVNQKHRNISQSSKIIAQEAHLIIGKALLDMSQNSTMVRLRIHQLGLLNQSHSVFQLLHFRLLHSYQ